MNFIPKGYNFVLFLGFDLDVDSAEMFKGEDPISLSRGRFAERRGLAKVLKVLDAFNLKVTFFVPGWVAERYPHLIYWIIENGHEISAHGYMHERFDTLAYHEELDIFSKMITMLKRVSGRRPVGFRAPYWKFSPYTLSNLVEYGFLYDSSLMEEEKPYVININEKRIVELPVDWRLDDWVFLEANRCMTPNELLEMWFDELDYAAKISSYIALTFHPQCIGRGARITILEKIIRKAKELGAWIPKGSELAKMML